jgi:ketosteroid isomerase-like protein
LSYSAQQGILAVQHQWLEYELDGNMTGVVSLCVDDVVWLPPNQPALRGKNAVATWLAVLPEHRIRRIEITNVQIHGSGGLAYKLGDFTTWFEEAGQASVEPVTGSHLWVLRESLPEHWQVAVVAWSTAEHTNAA